MFIIIHTIFIIGVIYSASSKDVDCHCSDLTLRDSKSGKTSGNCLTKRSGKAWCFVSSVRDCKDKKPYPGANGLYYSTLACKDDYRGSIGAPTVSDIKANEAALDGYRLGWASGETDIILGVCTDTFNFTWVPEDDVVSKLRFPVFFANFKADSEADGREKYFMQFDNIIHRQIGDTLYEAADWIVDGYDRGSYFNAAMDGKVIWDMATT